jgi:myo-inositol-1(or 4)-monophosphatase
MELIRICEQVIATATETGRFILGEQAKFKETDVESKGIHNLVSYVDKTAEEKLVAALSKILPEAGFITEEETVAQTRAEYNWIIDPLDGTTNFIHGLPCYAVSIALAKGDVPSVGVIY